MSAFSPTPAETALVNQIFTQYDPQKLGALTGDVAVNVFGGAKLPPTVLGEIWNIADEDNKGWLSKKGVSVAVRLIGWAQKGEKMTPALINKPGPPAHIDGLSVASHNTGSSLPKSPAPGVPQLTQQDKTKYDGLFHRSGPVNGLLSADKARDVFLKSNLSNDQLLQIWNLADTKDRGALDVTDFAIGMYLIQNVMTGKLPFIPTTLPPGLYQQAAVGGASTISGVASQSTGNSGSFSPVQSSFSGARSPVRPQYTGQQPVQPDHTGMSNQGRQPPRLPSRPIPAPAGSGTFGASPFGSSANQWDVTADEKANADNFFDTLDTQRKGYIDGDVAVPFMLQSNLPGDDLALVWDLSDIRNDGKLTRDCFAVAVHLIQKKLQGHPIPKALPPTLVPPSLRRPATNASPFAAPPTTPFQPPTSEPTRDLLDDWDETPAQTPAAAQPPPVAQHVTGQMTGSMQHAPSPHVSRSPPPPTALGPFGGRKDFLEDDDEAASSGPLQDHSAEIGNVRNHIDSTTKSLDSTKKERATLEQTNANQAAELSSMQSQLAVIKASYDHEMNLLQSLRDRFAAQAADIQKSKEELIRAESDLSAVKLEKAELEGGILRDKEEARGLNRKMTETTKEIEQLKADIEKAKKEAKQQKGLLAIAKKQLSTKETERARVEKELEDANAELNNVTTEREAVEAELALASTTALPGAPERAFSADSVAFAAAMPLPATPDPSSPTGSKSNNPFERLAMGSGSRSQSPFMPFATTTLSTPPVNGAVVHAEPEELSHDDPFGLNQLSDNMPPSKPAIQEPPQPHQGDTPVPQEPVAVPSDSLSPAADTELFETPPTTATPSAVPPASTEPAVPRSTTLDDVNAKFPLVTDSVPGAFPTGSPGPSKRQSTDLNHQLKDLEIEESDSDESDSDDDDEVPLGELKTKTEAVAHAADDKSKSTEPDKTNDATTNGHAASSVVTSSFDDVFGLTSDSQPAPPPASSPVPTTNGGSLKPDTLLDTTKPKLDSAPTDPFGLPSESTVPATNIPPPVAGVDAFDAAMSTISPAPAPASATPQFSFDDTFDFAAASATTAIQQPAPAPNGNTAPANGTAHFDDVFGFPSPSSGKGATAPAPVVAASGATPKPSFDDIFATGPQSQPSVPPSTNPSTMTSNGSFVHEFANFASTPSLNLDSSFAAAAAGVGATVADKSQSPPTSPKPFPSVSVPTSPERPHTSSISATSPPRATSPPPRVSSPKPRPSTSSSKEGHDKPKEPAVRHSKLSIRLPFGKKKKQEAPPPPPPAQFLTPPIEEPDRNVTPAVDDDVQQVKQLCNMGFSRSQAIDALERHSYDLPKALNSLLGTQ